MTQFRQTTDNLRGYLLRGDTMRICEASGVSLGTLYGAFRREAAADLREGERKAYEIFIEVARGRKQAADALAQKAQAI